MTFTVFKSWATKGTLRSAAPSTYPPYPSLVTPFPPLESPSTPSTEVPDVLFTILAWIVMELLSSYSSCRGTAAVSTRPKRRRKHDIRMPRRVFMNFSAPLHCVEEKSRRYMLKARNLRKQEPRLSRLNICANGKDNSYNLNIMEMIPRYLAVFIKSVYLFAVNVQVYIA